jgi:hypothetical protein
VIPHRVKGLEFQARLEEFQNVLIGSTPVPTPLCVYPYLPMSPAEVGAKQYDRASLRTDHLDGHRHLNQPRSEQ